QVASAENIQAMSAPKTVANRPMAQVRSFDANVTLTPRLSVGTANPESIYEAKFAAQIKASRMNNEAGEHLIELPLPPQIMSLSYLSVKVHGDPSESVRLEVEKLMSHGHLGPPPIDRLGELSWLGPTSVICFGLLLGLVAAAYQVQNFDKWMLLLVVGTYTGAFPLMYFAQEFIPLNWAMAGSMALVLIIIA